MDDPLWPVNWVIRLQLGDKIADLLEYFLISFPKFSSTPNDKELKMYDIHVLVRLKVFSNLRVFRHFGSVHGASLPPLHSMIRQLA